MKIKERQLFIHYIPNIITYDVSMISGGDDDDNDDDDNDDEERSGLIFCD